VPTQTLKPKVVGDSNEHRPEVNGNGQSSQLSDRAWLDAEVKRLERPARAPMPTVQIDAQKRIDGKLTMTRVHNEHSECKGDPLLCYSVGI
jgi:hypothetical protein